jgi:hypothetical protein
MFCLNYPHLSPPSPPHFSVDRRERLRRDLKDNLTKRFDELTLQLSSSSSVAGAGRRAGQKARAMGEGRTAQSSSSSSSSSGGGGGGGDDGGGAVDGDAELAALLAEKEFVLKTLSVIQQEVEEVEALVEARRIQVMKHYLCLYLHLPLQISPLSPISFSINFYLSISLHLSPHRHLSLFLSLSLTSKSAMLCVCVGQQA